MKLINRFLLTSVLLVISLSACAAPSLADPMAWAHADHSPVSAREVSYGARQRIQSISPGMTRADLLKIFVVQGGESLIYDAEFVYAIPVQKMGLTQNVALLNINTTLAPDTWEIDPETWSMQPQQGQLRLEPLFINGQCIKVRVKFAPDDSLLTLPVRPYRNFSPSDFFEEHVDDVILSISTPYWGNFIYD